MPDLRSYLSSVEHAIWHIDEPVSTIHELTALQYALQDQGRYPIIHLTQPRRCDGEISDLSLVCNLTASRNLVAAALRIDDHREAAARYSDCVAAPIEPRVVAPEHAPVQERVHDQSSLNLARIPAVTQHVLDPGAYLTAAHATTFDPDTGIDNTAIQRCWLKSRETMTYFPYPSSHNYRNMQKFWARGEPCPIAFWIGHHPAVLMGTQAKLGYPQSHWAAAGGLLGEPLQVVPTRTHGEQIMVPAEAEIVIEGWVPAGVLTPDGPFGEYTGYLGAQTLAALCEVSCITTRADPIYHDYGSGLQDMLVPDNMAMEGKLFDLIKRVAPALHNVHVPVSGRRFHAMLQLRDPKRGEARDALTAALSYRRIKTAIAVDEDIDIFSDQAMMWALATRVRWSRDSFVIDGLSTSTLDPALPPGATTGSKMGIDATFPMASRSGAPKPVPPPATVPDDASERARSRVAAAFSTDWPED